MSLLFLREIRFALDGFRSLLLTASRLISFPADTKTLQFSALHALSGLKGSPIRESLVRRLHAPRQSISLLATPFFFVLEPNHQIGRAHV